LRSNASRARDNEAASEEKDECRGSAHDKCVERSNRRRSHEASATGARYVAAQGPIKRFRVVSPEPGPRGWEDGQARRKGGSWRTAPTFL
jgi:hypothetical protein